jgi:GTP pyrophosphokinase
MTELKYLTPLMKRGADFLNVKYPVICGAMTWVSEPKLVSSVCNNGCFGCIAGGNAPTDILASQIEETRKLTPNSFGVNLITIAPSYQNHLAMLKDAHVPYIIHPLMMACHAQSMGLSDDTLLSVILLHDVCEDCGVEPADLPFSEPVRRSVELLTKKEDPSLSKEERNKVYYSGIAADPVASMAKIIDRCNNVSTMAQAFSDEKLNEYIEETETYVLPLLKTVKQNYLEYNNAVFLIKYHMLSVLESLKNMMMRN